MFCSKMIFRTVVKFKYIAKGSATVSKTMEEPFFILRYDLDLAVLF